jgi:Tol biopolymer transport system component
VTQLTNGFGFNGSLVQFYQPAWSPDGRKLAVVTCPQAYLTCDSSTIAVMNADGSGLTTLASARGMAEPTWSPDGRTIAYSTAGTIVWITADGGERGIIVADGYSPAWRP